MNHAKKRGLLSGQMSWGLFFEGQCCFAVLTLGWTHLRTPMVASLGSVPDRFVCADVFVSSSADQHS